MIFCCVIDNASDFPKCQQKIELFRQSQKTIVFAFPLSLSCVDRSFSLNAEPIYSILETSESSNWAVYNVPAQSIFNCFFPSFCSRVMKFSRQLLWTLVKKFLAGSFSNSKISLILFLGKLEKHAARRALMNLEILINKLLFLSQIKSCEHR